MKAILCHNYGGPEVLTIEDISKPVLKEDEVLVRVLANAVTTAGLISRKGTPKFTRLFTGISRPKNKILGMEFSGIIEESNFKDATLKDGDYVFGITGPKLGANAEFICIKKDAVIATIPLNIDPVEIAGTIEGGLTALHFLKNKAKLKKGQSILIYGASGSVGSASIQIAKFFGATVTAVCSTRNIELMHALGADNVIDYTKESFTTLITKYDVIFDTLGFYSFSKWRRNLRPNGKFLDSDNIRTVLDMIWTGIVGRKKAIFATTYLRSNQQIRHDLILLKEILEQNKFIPVIDKIYSYKNVKDAHAYVETKRKKGSVLIKF
jgi:NADPH:quinone reductase-like Zn-dependent oxidoreductase